ncbi:putative dehydrogenase [Microbacterium esteraromaticum]|uniref:Putative dehydrogenase n=1 Tax=Microbacterium esteraromaticum TaxID=57043 RepID=A0A1R4INV4_9MICO|nr:Gfo/Idh/MocA family oxidoreductase [Microbacterium esteraromaticum]SJN21547.1 putative dehydrogenase [Microbacterium esteraromaticum]
MNPLNVGLVGIENSHAEEIIHYLNVEHVGARGARISAIVGDGSDRADQLSRLGGIETIAETSADLLGTVDALIVTSRDGAHHRAHAVPFLESGYPVWVDKPLAASTADAEAIIAAAHRGHAPLTSSSAVRWVPDTDEIVAGMEHIGELQTVTVTGPADPTSEYSGIFFYGIHAADVAQRIVPGTPDAVDVQLTRDAVVARYVANDVLVTLELVRPDDDGRVPFRAMAVGRHGVSAGEIRLGDDYVAPGVEAFLNMLRTGTPPVAYEQLLAPIKVLESIREQEARFRR